MLFYEPLFLTVFSAFYAFYLLARRAPAKKWALLIGSTLFYLWGEPVFVLVLFVSTAVDYALSFHLNDPTPLRTRRLALAAGIARNVAILVVYKYADFLAGNLNLALAPFSSLRFPLLHLALPIGVSFVVFEKITYLVDSYRGTSRPAASFYRLLPVRVVLSETAGRADPQISRDEGPDRGPPADWSDFRTGFLRFAARARTQAPDRRSARRVRDQGVRRRPRRPRAADMRGSDWPASRCKSTSILPVTRTWRSGLRGCSDFASGKISIRLTLPNR